MYSYEQPNLDITKVILSAPRIFAAVYDGGTTGLFTGATALDVSAPASGWTDVGVVEGASITVSKNWVHSELGMPQTRRKSFEIKRESKLEFVLKEFVLRSLALLHGMSAKNIMRTTANTEGTIGASPTPSRTVVAVGAGKGTNYTAGDRVVTAADTAGLINSDNRAIVASVATDNVTLVGTGFPVAPTVGHKFQKYTSVELTDPMGAVNERAVLLFFDWEEYGVKRQFVMWFPRMTVTDPFSPDLKGGKDFADAKVSFESLATTQTLTDGTSKMVHGIGYFFD